MFVYYLLAAVVIWLGIKSLVSGVRYASFVRRECTYAMPEFTPYASVIAPCRGLHRGLKENISSLFRQDYPAYEIIFVTDSETDPCVSVIEKVCNENGATRVQSRLLFAGVSSDSGQKVHNLRFAVTQVNPQAEALVFVDADARPARTWLRSLVRPLQDEGIGATTGYRWFIAENGGLASHLLSIWNASIASALGAEAEKNFCWGGATAIRRTTFQAVNIRERWRGTVSDDFTVMRALKEAGLPIRFVPGCLTASLENYNFHELFEFTTRQLQITRVYAPQFWRSALIGGLLFNSVFFGGIVLAMVRAAMGLPWIISLLAPIIMFLLGTAKAYIRWRVVGIPLATYATDMRKSLLPHVLLWPLGAVLFLYNSTVAMFSRRILWRGIGYELKSPTEAVIISRQ